MPEENVNKLKYAKRRYDKGNQQINGLDDHNKLWNRSGAERAKVSDKGGPKKKLRKVAKKTQRETN